jgi:protein TonB
MRKWIKNHLFLLTAILSAVVQGSILFFIEFGNAQAQMDKKFIPFTIMPQVQEMQEQKEAPVKKEIVESSENVEPTKEEPLNQQQIVNQNTMPNGDPYANYLPFVRVDDIAKEKTSLKPEYPDLARNAGVEGLVVLEAYIDDNGVVAKVVLVKGIGFGCDEAAIRKIKNTAFIPAKMGGQAISVRQRFTFEFKLD